MTRLTGALVLGVMVGCAMVGCTSTTDGRALEGVEALRRCDLRAAHRAFDEAHAMEPGRSDVALAFALTDLATLAEDPALVALAPRLGFDRALDSAILWGEDGLLHRISRGDGCSTVSDFLSDSWPHPVLRGGSGLSLSDTLDPTLTLGDMRTALVTLLPRLARMAAAFETAARSMGPDGVTLEGGCGVGSTPTRVQAPELFALAAAMEALRGAILASRAYSGGILARLLLTQSSDQAGWVDMMNTHLLVVSDASALEQARTTFVRAVSLADEGVTAARAIGTRPLDSIFDWTILPEAFFDDAHALADGARRSLESGSVPIPSVEPPLSVDLRSFFATPIDFAGTPVWTLESGGFISSTGRPFEDALMPRLSPSPFGAMLGYDFEIAQRWSDFPNGTWEQLFDPGDRWSRGYDCTP